jgi:uncharacterized membrane protein
MMQKLLGNFLKGLLILVPLVLTVYVIYAVFVRIDGLLHLPIPGLGFVVTIVFIWIVGFLGSNIFFARLFSWFEKGLTRLPVVKLLYFSIKDLIGAFVGEKKSFTRPVMVSLGLPGQGGPEAPGLPGDDIRLMGFVTAETLDFPSSEKHVAVYMPTSYNFGGFLILVPRNRITPLTTVDSAKLMAFIVSGGVAKGSA